MNLGGTLMKGKVTSKQENKTERVLRTVCLLENCTLDNWQRQMSSNNCTMFINNIVSCGFPLPRADDGRHVILCKTDNHKADGRKVYGSVHIVTISHNTHI